MIKSTILPYENNNDPFYELSHYIFHSYKQYKIDCIYAQTAESRDANNFPYAI